MTCKSCGAETFFAKNRETGKTMILNNDDDPKGNVRLNADGTATVLKLSEYHDGPLFLVHQATCQYARDYRKRHPLEKS